MDLRRTLTVTLLTLLLNSVPALGQEAALVRAISKKVTEIDRRVSTLRTQKRDIMDLSTEGAEAKYYSSSRGVEKVAVQIYGETFRAAASVYFDKGKPIFAFKRTSRYDTQIGLSRKVKVIRVEEERYYFKGNDIFRILAGPSVVKSSDERHKEMSDGVNEMIKILLDELK